MDNINIKNIFDYNYNLTKSIIDNKNKYTIQNLNVDDLTQSLSSYVKLTDDFLINKIKYNEHLEQKKALDIYEVKYNDCLMKINSAIDVNMTDIFFKVVDAHFGCKLYTSYDCLNFIQNKLRKKNFDTLIISKNTIFISWKNSNFIKKSKNKFNSDSSTNSKSTL
jgi:hypothetical protein